MNLILDQAMRGVVVPLVVTGLALAAAAKISIRFPAFARSAGAAVGIGFFAGFAAINWIPWKPDDFWHWLPYLALLATVIGAVESIPGAPRVVFWFIRLGVASLAAWLLTPDWKDLNPVRNYMLAGIASPVLSVWCLLAWLARRQRDGLLPALLVLLLGVGAAVLALSESLKFAQLAGVLAAALSPLVPCGWRWRNEPLLLGAVPAIAIVLPGLMLEGYFYSYSSVPLASFALIIAAPLAMSIGILPALQSKSRAKRAFAQIAATTVPLAAALILAARA